MSWLARWLRPSALTGLTTGLKYVGTLSNGRKVYSNLRVETRTPDEIHFVGGSFANVEIIGGIGEPDGTVVVTWGESSFFPHFMSVTTRPPVW